MYLIGPKQLCFKRLCQEVERHFINKAKVILISKDTREEIDIQTHLK